MGGDLSEHSFDTPLWRTLRERDAAFQPVALGENLHWLCRLLGDLWIEQHADGGM
jgi:hypothetical protein